MFSNIILILLQISYVIPSKVNILPYYSNVNTFFYLYIHFFTMALKLDKSRL